MVVTVESSERTDEQLAREAAREGSNGPAFMALLERHRERVWRTCYRLMGNEHDARDATQEVFVRLFLQRAQFAEKSKYTTWLHGIAIRTCLTLRRSRGRREKRESTSTQIEQTEQPVEKETTSGQLSLDLTTMLESLNEEDRALIIMKYAEDYSYEELSEMFGLSVSGCKMRISRAREKLRDKYSHQAEHQR